MNEDQTIHNTYTHIHSCGNCHFPNLLVIPKGTTIESYLTNHSCSKCGVALKQSEYRMRKDRPTL